MAEEIPADPAASQQIHIMLDERDMRQVYTNAYRIHATADEIIIDLGFNMPNPNPNPGQQGPQQVLWKVSDRVIMSYFNAKRLSQSLAQQVKRYEQQFGELMPPGQRK